MPLTIVKVRRGVGSQMIRSSAEKDDAVTDAIKQIHALLNTPGTISLGYNTLGFDDEFLRFSFYRNLLPPYTHQYANQCGRMDLYPITLVYYLFNPDVLSWPQRDGRVSMKLESLSQENNLATGQAHDAMVDVEATLALAKKLRQKTEMWEYLEGYFNKQCDLDRLAKLNKAFDDYQQGILVDGKLGSAHNFSCPVLALGQHNHYTNKTLWLRLDQEILSECTLDSIVEKTFVIAKKAGEPGIILPFNDRYSDKLSAKQLALYEKNLHWLQENPYLLKAIKLHHKEQKFPEVPNLDIDAALYTIGFPTQEEQRLCQQFHGQDAKQKAAMLEQIQNPILKDQAIRIIGRFYQDELTGAHKKRFESYLDSLNPPSIEKAAKDYRNTPRLSTKEALKEIEALLVNEKLDNQQVEILGDLKDYLNNRNRRSLWQ